MKPSTSALLVTATLAACSASQRTVVSSSTPARSTSARPHAAPTRALNEAEQAREIASVARRVTALRWEMQRRLDTARGRGDRGEQRCLDEGLTELDATMRLVEEQRTRFEDEVGGDIAARRAQGFRRVMILRARAEEVHEEAGRCERGDVIDGTVTTVVVREP